MAAFVQCLCSTFIARLLLKTSLACTAVRSIEEGGKRRGRSIRSEQKLLT